MKTAIVYYSEHHGNTKKLLDAIAAEHEVTLINVTKQPKVDLSGFDRIGLASGKNTAGRSALTGAGVLTPSARSNWWAALPRIIPPRMKSKRRLTFTRDCRNKQ